MKPFIDENNLQDAVGLNYTQNDVDGHIYTVHDQLESRGLWYNAEVLEKAGVKPEEAFADWDASEQQWKRFAHWMTEHTDMQQDRVPALL